ncbi:glutaredoxin family protein [Flavobacteriales bacterium]|jgi:thioredoxin reductase (NADPH)|nr:glutaredoxin family protein [Flavobacteriales bacterium]MDG1426594.1 glutaredoxin family protein [Flavobacteriales bacterium]MDG2086911.1 glutaredoxin family protein [Flavobacteriales bacterium]|tara:strand:- start:1046 stop:1276 length:231 start_codon:yes stop_codon:yes gene_type:complete
MTIKIYGADWCSDCIVAKNFLSSNQIQFDYIDITDNDIAIKTIEKINNGKRIIPTILVDDKVYVNPGISELMKIIS